ncbi:MAG: DNA adenine methylase, partial [Lachnospiraceae bacterium]|nr:DNA adenine methylase [Lachnospiraceae bacterium]
MNYSATQMAKKLDISRSYLYYLKDNGIVQIEVNEKGRTMWTEAVYNQLREYIKKNNIMEKNEAPELPYKTTKINNRRYLGNKYKLLPFITRVLEEECENVNTVADIFAGTGAVASAFTDKKLITNDIMYSNYICHMAWFSSEDYSEEKLVDIILEYNSMNVEQDNYMSENFANTYFSLEDCRKIGFIRQDIEDRYADGEINTKERALLITSLLYAMDK